jgi:hypothetical protein
MIQKSRLPNGQQKIITRQVNLAIQPPPPMPEYLDWSDQYIGFGREDHPYKIPRPGHSPLVLDAKINGYDCGRIFLDACMKRHQFDLLQDPAKNEHISHKPDTLECDT